MSHDDLGNSGGVVGSGLVHLSRVRRWADRWAHAPVSGEMVLPCGDLRVF